MHARRCARFSGFDGGPNWCVMGCPDQIVFHCRTPFTKELLGPNGADNRLQGFEYGRSFRLGQEHFFRMVIRPSTELARLADSMRRMARDSARGFSGFIRRRLTQTEPGSTYWPLCSQ